MGDYESGMTGRQTLAEMVRALLVLGLVFLNFAHQPAFAAQSGHEVLAALAGQSVCGAPIGDDEGGHAPCHACRIGSGADLPPVVDLPAAAIAVVVRLTGEPVAVALERGAVLPAGARAPPAA